jgi:hypothetical protein
MRGGSPGIGLLLTVLGAVGRAAAQPVPPGWAPAAPVTPPARPPTTPEPGPGGMAPPAPLPAQETPPPYAGDPGVATSPAAPAATTAIPAGRAAFAPGLGPMTMDEVPVLATNSRVVLNIFGDTAFMVDSSNIKRPAFVLGPLDLLLLGRYGNLMAIAEAVLEAHHGGEVGVDLERNFVRWRTERFTIDAGRTHTELGYWNNAFHHGRWLQPSVDRPHALLFEDDAGILPIHWIGLTTKYRLLTGDRQLELIGSVGNGRGNVITEIHTDDDTNTFKSLLLKLEARGFGARDLHVGVSGVYDHIAPAPVTIRPALPDQAIKEAIGNAYLAYRGPALTIVAEAFEIHHSALGLQWNTFNAFALAGYRFDHLIPYVMGEVRAGDVAIDPFFFPDRTQPSEVLGRFKEGTAGVRWDVNTWSAIKLEYRMMLVDADGSRVHRGIIDWTFGL